MWWNDRSKVQAFKLQIADRSEYLPVARNLEKATPVAFFVSGLERGSLCSEHHAQTLTWRFRYDGSQIKKDEAAKTVAAVVRQVFSVSGERTIFQTPCSPKA